MEYPPKRKKHKGSTTNASDKVDDVEIPPDADEEDVLDEGLQETFPASDPVSVQKTYKRKKTSKAR
ncbi:MAG TPA: hypothetical protein VNP36_00060 [Burkholderiales bacterium]|nr:hypothetical protein [Burkholderiales bacterium]